ncbi:MAG: MOSC domain-containing protein [Acidimicrobiales bacterium]
MAVPGGARIGQVVSVNVGAPREVPWGGRMVRTAIWKEPVAGPVEVRGANLAGDGQADRRVHGGTHKAVYAYAVGDYAWWSEQLGVELAPGTFGENLTVGGIDPSGAQVGERWRVGSCVLEVSEPRFPCFKLGIRMGTADFVDLFEMVGRLGTYLRIVEEGAVEAGDPIDLLSRPDQPLTVAELAKARQTDDVTLLERVAAHPAVAPRWADAARRALGRQG